MPIQLTKIAVIASLALGSTAITASADTITERLAAGDPIRIGFSNVPIWGYPDENGEAKGFVNEIAIGILAEMGITDVETTVTDWAGLIPGLQAGRYDLITGGLYILNSRCENIAFSEPIGSMGDAFIVPAGNPRGINNYQDVLALEDAVLVTPAGYNSVEAARREGLEDDQLMQVPGPSEVLAAVRAGRADAGAVTYFEADFLAGESDGTIDVTDPSALPEWTLNWVGIGMRFDDSTFMADFNAALADYVGTGEMLASVEEYGFTAAHLPGDQTTEWVCANR